MRLFRIAAIKSITDSLTNFGRKLKLLIVTEKYGQELN